MPRRLTSALFLLAACLSVASLAAPAPELRLRIRATRVEPRAFVRIFYPSGQSWAEVTAILPKSPDLPGGEAPGLAKGPKDDLEGLEEAATTEPEIYLEEGQAYNYLWLKPGTWSPSVPVGLFDGFATLRIEGLSPKDWKTRVAITRYALEFELSYGGKVLKTFTEDAGEGPRLTIHLPTRPLRRADGTLGPPTADFIADAGSLLDYAKRRAEHLERLPWAAGPLPRQYGFMTACSGWLVQSGNPEVFFAEYRTLRQLGVNGLVYGSWDGFDDAVKAGKGIFADFGKLRCFNANQLVDLPGYGVPPFDRNLPNAPGHGCPSHPVHANRPAQVRQAVDRMVANLRDKPFEEYWLRTVDEIGSYFDQTAEGKAHQGVCPHCREAFREFIKGFGLNYTDFGASSWDEIRSTFGYWSKSWEEQQRELAAGKASAEAKLAAESADPDRLVVDQADEAPTLAEPSGESAAAGDESATPPGAKPIPLPPHGQALLLYFSRRFNNEASARLFGPLRDELNRHNALKDAALAAGDTTSPVARQPKIYAQSLRGNTWLMGGHSLDFFDWYRQGENAFMYETSNRDPRVWQWDSQLCEVGRIIQAKLGHRLALMIKPGRGAVIQRTLTAAARQARTVYWYTYGPNWHHPDTFAKGYPILEKVSRVVHLLGEAESVIYDADWALAPEIAVVRPLTSAFFDGNAGWENGKWVHQALTHAHLPVDTLDEGFLMSEDLKRYKVIYISGSHLRRDVADKLANWVAAGGVLYSSGGSLRFDEANRPLTELQAVLGLKARSEPDVWVRVPRYGATRLNENEPLKDPPAGAVVTGGEGVPGSFPLRVGREVLEPVAGAEVLARFADGGAAALRHAHGQGWAYTIGFFAGAEYASDILRQDYDMVRDFRADKRGFVAAAALAHGVRPAVASNQPLVEGVLMRHRTSGKLAVILMNWAYRGYDLQAHDGVTLRLRGQAGLKHARSTWLRQTLPITSDAGDALLTLPRLEDGDILLLE